MQNVHNVTPPLSCSAPNTSAGAVSTALNTTQQAHDTKASTLTHLVLSQSYKIGSLLPTAIVNSTNELGQTLPARALLYSGSKFSLITEALVQALHLKRIKYDATIYSINSLTSGSNT